MLTEFERLPDGRLGERRTFADLSAEGIYPDGISFDETGCVWAGIGHGGGAAQIRDGGEVLQLVAPLGGHWVLACVLGGPDRTTLYMAAVTTTIDAVKALDGPGSRGHADHDRWVRSQSTGWIEQVPVDVAGAGTP
jgi:sugar lactone lactonase YvrE